MKTKEAATNVIMTNVESVKANSMENMIQEATTTKGDKVANVEDVTSKEAKVTNEKKISLAQSEKAVVSLIEKLIGENTAKIARLIFSNEIEAEFQVQISELENDKQMKNANILRVMQEKFWGVESGANFVEFKANISELRAKAIQEYKELFEAEKLRDEKRKAIETQISALTAVRDIIGGVAYANAIEALEKQIAAI